MRTVNINIIPQKIYLISLRPDPASMGDDTLLVRSEYEIETDASGNASVDLPVPVSGSLRYEWSIINSNLSGTFFLADGPPINFEDLVSLGAQTTPSITDYIDQKIDAAIADAIAALPVLGLFDADSNGLVPASGGGTVNFLRADGTWQPVSVAAPSASLYVDADGKVMLDNNGNALLV